MLQTSTPSRSGRPTPPAPAHSGATATPAKGAGARRRRARVPVQSLAHHWIGPFYCATEACGTILGEMFADAGGTYLASLGGRPVRAAALECPACGATRQFISRPAQTPPLVAQPDSEYDLGNRDAEPPR